jgi:hypothetical protein
MDLTTYLPDSGPISTHEADLDEGAAMKAPERLVGLLSISP